MNSSFSCDLSVVVPGRELGNCFLWALCSVHHSRICVKNLFPQGSTAVVPQGNKIGSTVESIHGTNSQRVFSGGHLFPCKRHSNHLSWGALSSNSVNMPGAGAGLNVSVANPGSMPVIDRRCLYRIDQDCSILPSKYRNFR